MSAPLKFVKSLENRIAPVLSNLREVAMSGQYSDGQFTAAAAKMVQKHIVAPATMMNSCGSALYCAYRWLKSQGHTTALIQNNTFYATGAMALEAGLDVRLVDSTIDCPSMGFVSLLEAHKKSPEATVVVLTHVGGWLAKDYERIAQYCRHHHLFLLEDCAHAFGVPSAGLWADAACWSFYATKAVPCGEGGALTSLNPQLNRFAALFVNYGKEVVNDTVAYSRGGFNLRMSEWDAAVLCAQLESFPDMLADRARDAERLQSIAPCLLSGNTNWYKYPVAGERAAGLKTVGSVYSLTDQLMVALSGYVCRGVNAPSVKSYTGLPHSEHWATNHVCLPIGEGIYDGMTDDQLKEILKA